MFLVKGFELEIFEEGHEAQAERRRRIYLKN
jgi:hypothetical protein